MPCQIRQLSLVPVCLVKGTINQPNLSYYQAIESYFESTNWHALGKHMVIVSRSIKKCVDVLINVQLS